MDVIAMGESALEKLRELDRTMGELLRIEKAARGLVEALDAANAAGLALAEADDGTRTAREDAHFAAVVAFEAARVALDEALAVRVETSR